jgi:hypothetical protein
MSIWGSGPFENDDAADWLTELDEEPNLEMIDGALDELADPAHVGYAEIPECCTAVAAAEVLARLFDAAHEADVLERETWSDLSAEFRDQSQEEVARYLSQATAAVHRVLNDADDSELRQVWEQKPTGFAAWSGMMQGLLQRLQTIAERHT